MAHAATGNAPHRAWWLKLLIALGVLVLALVLLAVFFPWDTLRGPVNRYVSKKTGRHFEITRHLDVKLGRTTRVLMDGIEFANPDWAQDRNLVTADAVEVDIRVLPLLLHRRIELPYLKLTKPQLGLQIEPDGRRTWALGSDTKDPSNVPQIGNVVVDQGSAHYVDGAHGADVHADFAMQRNAVAKAGTAAPLPLQFKATGRWQGQPFQAQGATGDVLSLNGPQQHPFPAEVRASAGATQLRANGSVANLAALDGADISFQLQGEDLGQLYKLVGVALPNTPRYSVAGHLTKQGDVFNVRQIDGHLGRSDIAGDMAYDSGGQRPSLQGALRSKMLDFEDLAPLIGMKDDPAQKRADAQAAAATPAGTKPKKAPADPNRKVLPDAPLDVSRLRSMDADVRVDAARIVNAKGMPLDRAAVHVQLKNGVLLLDPLNLGVAGGQLAGSVRVDSNTKPVQAQAKLDGRALQLERLLPASAQRKDSIGRIQAQIDLTATGNSVAQLLGSSSGNVAMLMGSGRISNILLEFAGLDAGEVLKFLVEGDKTVELRCGAAAFDVQKGLMTSKALVLDTNDTVIYGQGQVNLANESMDLIFRPYPKDKSILSVRSPLKLQGTFGAPKAGVEKGALIERAAVAIGLGAINPLLGLASTIETGPGKDADCAGTLRQAGAGRAEARVNQSAPPPTASGGKSVGDKNDQRVGAAPQPKPQEGGAQATQGPDAHPGKGQQQPKAGGAAAGSQEAQAAGTTPAGGPATAKAP